MLRSWNLRYCKLIVTFCERRLLITRFNAVSCSDFSRDPSALRARRDVDSAHSWRASRKSTANSWLNGFIGNNLNFGCITYSGEDWRCTDPWFWRAWRCYRGTWRRCHRMHVRLHFPWSCTRTPRRNDEGCLLDDGWCTCEIVEDAYW